MIEERTMIEGDRRSPPPPCNTGDSIVGTGIAQVDRAQPAVGNVRESHLLWETHHRRLCRLTYLAMVIALLSPPS